MSKLEKKLEKEFAGREGTYVVEILPIESILEAVPTNPGSEHQFSTIPDLAKFLESLDKITDDKCIMVGVIKHGK